MSSVIVFLFLTSPAAAQNEPALAVLPLRSTTIAPAKVAVLDRLLVSAIDAGSGYRVMSPADVDAVLGVEKTKEAAGCDDLRCAAEIAGALGARYLASASADVLGDKFVLTLSVIDSQETRVVARQTWQGINDEGRYYDALQQIVRNTINSGIGTANVDMTARASITPTTGAVAGKTLGIGLHYYVGNLDSNERSGFVGVFGEYIIPQGHGFALTTRIGLAAPDFSGPGLGLGVGEKYSYVLHRTEGNRTIEVSTAVNLYATVGPSDDFTTVGTGVLGLGLKIFWLSLEAGMGYTVGGPTNGTPSKWVSPELVAGLSLGLSYDI